MLGTPNIKIMRNSRHNHRIPVEDDKDQKRKQLKRNPTTRS